MKIFQRLNIILSLAAFLCSPEPLAAKKIKYNLSTTKSGKHEPETHGESQGKPTLTLTPDSTRFRELKRVVTLSGYDKRMNSNFETFLIYNGSNDTITSFSIDLEYKSTDNQPIHERAESIRQTIPPGTRRKIDIRSWDRQHSYYYHRSTPPRNSAIPYTVTITLNSITLLPTP